MKKRNEDTFSAHNSDMSSYGSLWTIVVCLSLFLLPYIYFTRKFKYWKNKNLFYLQPIPLMGSFLSALKVKQTLAEWLGDLCKKTKEDCFGIFVFDQPVLVVQSPKLVKAILQKDSGYFQNRSVASYDHDPVMQNLMFFSKDSKWKEARTKLSPVFTSGKLKQMFPLILEESQTMTKYIAGIENVPDVECKEICAKYSTNVIAKCAFAVDAQSFKSDSAEFRNLGRRIFEFRTSTALRQFASMLAPKFANTFNITFLEPFIIKRLGDIFLDVFHTRMTSNHKGNDMVDIFVEARRNSKISAKFDDNMVAGQALQFFAAGFETVSGILSFTLYELCIQPEIQNKLRDEVLKNIKQYNGITYDGVSEMKYLDMCVAETLRKYPVLPFIDRQCLSDYKVEGSDLIIEKGTPVYIPMFSLHHNPNFFPEPNKYDPERFREKSNINQNGLYYVPFGDGPRNCIGARFGLLGVKTGLASIISNYKLEATEKTPVPIKFELKSFVLQSSVGVPLKFVPLN